MLDCERASPPSLPLVTHVAFAELCPCGASHIMLVEVHDLAAMMQQDHEHVEHAKGSGRHDEEVDGDEVGEVVLEERAPSLRWRFRAMRHEPGDASLRDVESELEQFAVDAWRVPEGIRERHGAHEIRNLRANQRSTWSPAVGLPGPEGAEALPVPANYGLGAYEVERLAPSRPPVGEPQPEGAIEAPESGSLRSAAEQGELLSERQVLEREVGAGPERRAQGAQESECEGHCGPWLARRWPIVQSWRTILANDRAASLLDFLDAERSYRTTQLGYRQAIAAHLLASEQVRQAVGTRSLQ